MLGARDERATEKATYWSNILSGAVVSVLMFLAGLGLGGFTGAALGQAVQSSDWSEVTGPRYLSPIDLKLSPDGQQLYVVCEDSDLLLVVDTHNRQVTGRVKVGHRPKAIAVARDGEQTRQNGPEDNGRPNLSGPNWTMTENAKLSEVL